MPVSTQYVIKVMIHIDDPFTVPFSIVDLFSSNHLW